VKQVTRVDLTDSQRAAYEARESRLLIVGGPGTGKTAVALLMARRILEEEPPTSVRRVLFLTFSRSATFEVLQRAREVFAGEIGQRIDISTFHGFAMAMLNGFGRFAGGSVEPLTILTREEAKLRLARPGAVPFDEFIPSALKLLRAAPWLRDEYKRRYVAVICDEFQDTSAMCAQLLEDLACDGQLICLADPDQVIFDWIDRTVRKRLDEYRASGAKEYDLGYDSRRDPSNVIPRAAAAIRRREFDDEAIVEACHSGRLRVLRHEAADEPFELLVDQIRASLAAGATEVGVFFATNKSVNEFTEILRDEDIEHEIIGLSGAAGEAQVAVAAAAMFAVGDATWEEFLVALGIFVASCYRGNPPLLAVGLVREPQSLEAGLIALLKRERDAILRLAGKPLDDFIENAISFWRRLFHGRPRQLWELGVRDLRGQTLGLRRRPMSRGVARGLTQVAQSRRASAYVDEIPSSAAPVRLMNIYQVKGREMDEVFLVHLPEDRDEWKPEEMRRLCRVHYVSISRARKRATIVLPAEPKPFFLPYRDLRS
jgi:DNA helicase-2/ATP-dependent DNA helicase PcrA